MVSTAINPSNPVVAAFEKLPVVPRALMLTELMRMKRGIAIAGTHGKTTTTSLVASVLAEGGLDPTFVIGGRLLAAGSNARLGSGEFLVAEADESDASFLHLSPTLAVITNIDADHMETYGHSLDRLHQAFVDFAHRLPFYGSLYACLDDEGVAGILPRVVKPVVTYGLSEAADIRATDIRADASMMHFTAKRERYADLPVSVQVAGLHNVRNALAAIAIAQDLEVPADAIARALRNFGGVGRRFSATAKSRITVSSLRLIDDYGHHPVELKTTLAAASLLSPGRLGACISTASLHAYARFV